MFKLIFKLGPYGDQTADYDIELNGQYTVESFIQDILSKEEEWGKIFINVCYYCSNGRLFFSEYQCEYKHGKLLTHFPDEKLGLTVISAKSRGGRSAMDYYLSVK